MCSSARARTCVCVCVCFCLSARVPTIHGRRSLQVVLEMAISTKSEKRALNILIEKRVSDAALVAAITNLLKGKATRAKILTHNRAWAPALLSAVKPPPAGAAGHSSWCSTLLSIVQALQLFDDALAAKTAQGVMPAHLESLSRILCAWAQDVPKADAMSQLCISLAGDKRIEASPLVRSLARECAMVLRKRTLEPLPVYKSWALNVDLGCSLGCRSCDDATAFLKARNRDAHEMFGEAVIFGGHTTLKLQAASALSREFTVSGHSTHVNT